MEWLAEEVVESGGQAGCGWRRAGTVGQERTLAVQMTTARAAEYVDLMAAATAARLLDHPLADRRWGAYGVGGERSPADLFSPTTSTAAACCSGGSRREHRTRLADNAFR
jgi:hypothetical protein